MRHGKLSKPRYQKTTPDPSVTREEALIMRANDPNPLVRCGLGWWHTTQPPPAEQKTKDGAKGRRPGRPRPPRHPLKRFLPFRQRGRAPQNPHPRLDATLEPPLEGRRAEQGEAAGHSRR